MSEGGKRPGGLTALAVFNFIGGGFDLLGALGTAAIIFLLAVAIEKADEPEKTNDETNAERSADDPPPPQKNDEVEELRKMGITPTKLWIKVGLLVVLAILLVTSGVGYLKQKKFLGRTLGNGYALTSLGTAAFDYSMIAGMPDKPASTMIGIAIALVYPILTLIHARTVAA